MDLMDTSSERAILSSIFTKGKDAFIEVSSFLDGPEDFSNNVNRSLYSIFQDIDKSGYNDFGYENILLSAKRLGLTKEVESKDFHKYLSVLDTAPPSIDSLSRFCHNVKKWKVCRDLKSSCRSINEYIDKDVNNQTKIPDIIAKTEEYILDYIDGAVTEDEDTLLLSDIGEVVNEAIASTTIMTKGIPTGFPIWDSLIGGGPRPGGTSFCMARPKVGKSTKALNVCYNVATSGMPVLYLDSELIKRAVMDKIICIHSGIPIPDWESTSFNGNPVYVESAKEAVNSLKDLPFGYINIAGRDIHSIISLCRRWINKYVGFNEKGKANPCLIVYDYFKLTNTDSNNSNQAEWLQLGLMLTALNTFLIKYEVPLLSYGQMNRSGMDEDDGRVIAGSDRILWFCNDFSTLRNKTDDDESLGCGWEYGNKKLKIIESRYGSGMSTDSDYINIEAKIRPRCHSSQATGKMKEGKLYSSVVL